MELASTLVNATKRPVIKLPLQNIAFCVYVHIYLGSRLKQRHFTTFIVCASAARGGGGGVTPLCDLNGNVRPDRVWFLGFVLNGVSISSLSVLNRVSLHYLMA